MIALQYVYFGGGIGGGRGILASNRTFSLPLRQLG